MSTQRKVFIRLDDGSLIGRAADFGRPDPSDPGKVVRLSVDQAAVLGRASDKEVARLQAILTRVRQQYPAPLKAPDKVRRSMHWTCVSAARTCATHLASRGHHVRTQKALQRVQSARVDAGAGHAGGGESRFNFARVEAMREAASQQAWRDQRHDSSMVVGGRCLVR